MAAKDMGWEDLLCEAGIGLAGGTRREDRERGEEMESREGRGEKIERGEGRKDGERAEERREWKNRNIQNSI